MSILPTILYILNKKSKNNKNKNTLLDQQTVRKQLDIMPTYHYVENQGKLIMQSGENGQKPQFG